MKPSTLWQWFLGEKPEERESLGKYMLGALKFVLIACAFTQIAHGMGKLSSKQTNTLDTALHLNPIVADRVTIIAIDDDDYIKLFNGKSPLGPEKLVQLIKAASIGEPAVIAVDVDTTDPVYRRINLIRNGNSELVTGIECRTPERPDPSTPATVSGEPQSHPITFKKPLRLVWAVGAIPKEVDLPAPSKPATNSFEQFVYDLERMVDALFVYLFQVPKHVLETFGVIKEENLLPEMTPRGVLGKSFAEIKDGDRATSSLPLDGDGLIRHYFRTVRNPDSHESLETFPFAVFKAWAKSQSKVDVPANEEELSKKFVMRLPSRPGDIPNFKASLFIDSNGAPTAFVSGEGWYDRVHGNVVLIGGHFGAARDQYVTPAGLKYGVDLMAAAIESEIQKILVAPAHPLLLLAFELVVGLGLSYLCWAFPNGWIAEGSFILLPFIAAALSVLFFSTTSMWFDFATVIYAAQFHQKLEQKEEIKKLRKELAHLSSAHRSLDTDQDTKLDTGKNNQPE